VHSDNTYTPSEALNKNAFSDKTIASDESSLAVNEKTKTKRYQGGRAPSAQHRQKADQKFSASARTYTQPSAISTGDKGIFVTCDKGREKKCLQELDDLIHEFLETKGLDTFGNELDSSPGTAGTDSGKGIEDDIARELNSMRDSDTQKNHLSSVKPLQLITLDVPCVSFVRFPAGSTLDPVDMVHSICLLAADNQNPQRCRYIKRLTPVLSLAKTLSQGLLKACDEALPSTFGLNQEGFVHAYKFAIRPTTRNNDKLNRDEVIKTVADKVQELGGNMHSVDLSQYEKGILVEVYRNWVGMSVVDNTDTTKYKLGFEQLKRFNIAEIYATR
jgi:tRNA acetyltransferase TAN1